MILEVSALKPSEARSKDTVKRKERRAGKAKRREAATCTVQVTRREHSHELGQQLQPQPEAKFSRDSGLSCQASKTFKTVH